MLLASLLRQAFQEVAERFGLTIENCPKNLAFCTEQRVLGDFERGAAFWVLERGGQPCGCVAIEQARADVCYLERLAVLPRCRGQGYGTRLVEHAFSRARQAGAKRVEIGIIAADERLRAWYESFGFVQTGTKQFEHLPFVVAFLRRTL